MTTTYELRVEGQLDSHWSGVLGSAFLGGLSLSHDGDGTSTLTCPVADQAQLHGLLAGLRDIGASLLSVRALTEETLSEDGTLSEQALSTEVVPAHVRGPGATGHHAGGRAGRTGRR
jgi:hypothetical protein